MMAHDAMDGSGDRVPRRLAIVGAGSSGLVAAKAARRALPDWETVVFERSQRLTGCWGRPYPGFVSTSTKFTTQFSSFPRYDAVVDPARRSSAPEFFCGGEYGDYLEAFATAFELRSSIRFQHVVHDVRWDADRARWRLRIDDGRVSAGASDELFDAVIMATGLAAVPKPVQLAVPHVPVSELFDGAGLHRSQQTVVVLGGGESAVDHACRMAEPRLGNRVYLSLASGVRVSPRYHPIGGVPSDFLRNRWMLSIHEDLRNAIGQRFVEARIRYEELFRRWFPHRAKADRPLLEPQAALKKEWAWRLTQAAKADLFNMFHNKSDGFLEAIAEGRIEIIGAPCDASGLRYFEFQSSDIRELRPDAIVPSIGYRSTLCELFEGQIEIADAYLGVESTRWPNLFFVGFARPIIGNIPSISEMQAEYIAQRLAGRLESPRDWQTRHTANRQGLERRFAKLNRHALMPVEMFPYCDRLASALGRIKPRTPRRSLGERFRWWLAPATTLQYAWDEPEATAAGQRLPIYMPWLLIGLIGALKPLDWIYRAWRWARRDDSREYLR